MEPFDFVEKLREHPERARAAVNGDLARSLATVFLDLAAGACNHACGFCDGTLYPFEPARFTTGRLLALADEIAALGADSAIFAGENSEPTLHPGFVPFAGKLLRLGLRLGLYTNGTRMDHRLAVLGGFAFVRVSLDAGTEATHRRVHGAAPGDFGRLRQFLVRARDAGTALVGASFVVLPENVHEIAAAARFVRGAGADFLEVKPVYGPRYSFDAARFRSLLPALRRELAAARALAGPGFRVLLNNQLRDVLEGEAPVEGLTALPLARPCLTSRLRLVVSPRGCWLCPPHRGQEEWSLGDARTASLQDLWHGARHRRLLAEPCALRCPYHAQNEALRALQSGVPLPGPGAAAPVAQTGFL